MSRTPLYLIPAALLLVTTGCSEGSLPVAPDELAAGDLRFSHTQGMATGRARLHPENQSGVKGVIEFIDNGSTLTINGTATGLDPAGTYISLIYDNGSVPGGPEACEPAIFDPTDPGFLIPTMRVGGFTTVWAVDANGNGTLTAVNIVGVYVPLTKFRTISIRKTTGLTRPPFPLVACGEVATHPAG